MPNQNKSIFVSSTFRDMQAERDALQHFSLPRINDFAEQYGHHVELIDLRWGVDTTSVSEAEQNYKVLRTCLDEIERSRPYFLALMGDRYGWTPPPQDMEAALQAADFSVEDLNMSVTALEIEYGVLHSKIPSINFFYFRERPDYTAMSDDLRQIYHDKGDDCTKLAELKERIHSHSDSNIKNYTPEIDEGGLTVSKEWAEMVADDIIAKLREIWGKPSSVPIDWKEHEWKIQDSFRESRTEHFEGRIAEIEKLVAFCVGEGEESPYLMIQGKPGSGKSGLLCKIIDEIEDKCLLLPFCCGLSSRSSLVENMLRYFISLLCEKLLLEDDSDEIIKFQDLKNRFIELLFIACEKTRVVVIVDALDQLIGSNEARRMLWMNGRFPENFRILCSIIDGRDIDGMEIEFFKQYGGKVRPIPPINKEDQKAIIHSIAKRNRKEIGRTVVEHILQKQTSDGTPAAQNPLYLSLITQNFVMMDRYEFATVQQHMDSGLKYPEALAKVMCQRIDETPGDPEDVYLAILHRLEQLIGGNFVRGVCGMIAVSRSGLRESDMESAFKELDMNFNPADFSWLRQMLRGHISQGDLQQWNFSHQSLRRALQKDRMEELKRLNESLVDYFINTWDVFVAREIMHHLCTANRPDLAAETVSLYYDTHENALVQGLADVYVEHKTGQKFLLAVPTHTKNIEGTKRRHIMEAIDNCLPFLPENTHPFRVELMLMSLSMLDGQEDIETQIVITVGEDTIADLYTEMGRSKEAEIYYHKFLETSEAIYHQTGTEAALSNLAVSWSKMGDHLTKQGCMEEAGEYYQKILETFEEIYQKSKTTELLRSLAVSWGRMGEHLMKLGHMEEAGTYYQKALEAFETIYHQTKTTEALIDLAVALEKVGDHLTELRHMKKAGVYYQKALEASEAIYHQTGTTAARRDLLVAWHKIGDHLTELRQMKETGVYYQKTLEMSEAIYQKTGTTAARRDLAASWNKMGNYLTEIGRMEEAGDYYHKFLEASETIYYQTSTPEDLRNLSVAREKIGDHLMKLGRMEEARTYYQKALEASEMIYHQTKTTIALRDLAVAWNKMGDYLTKQEDMEKAGKYYQKSLDVLERISEQNETGAALIDVIRALDKIGNNKHARGIYDEARTHHLKALKLFKQYVKIDPSVPYAKVVTTYLRCKTMHSRYREIISRVLSKVK